MYNRISLDTKLLVRSWLYADIYIYLGEMEDLEACAKLRYKNIVTCSFISKTLIVPRIAVRQGNIIRVEEALKLAGVNPNIKVTRIASETLLTSLLLDIS